MNFLSHSNRLPDTLAYLQRAFTLRGPALARKQFRVRGTLFLLSAVDANWTVAYVLERIACISANVKFTSIGYSKFDYSTILRYSSQWKVKCRSQGQNLNKRRLSTACVFFKRKSKLEPYADGNFAFGSKLQSFQLKIAMTVSHFASLSLLLISMYNTAVGN